MAAGPQEPGFRSNSMSVWHWLAVFSILGIAYGIYIVVSNGRTKQSDNQALLSSERTRGATAQIPRWKKIGRTLLLILTWIVAVTSLLEILTFGLSPSTDSPDARSAGIALFYGALGIGVLSAVYAQRRKPLWFLLGLVAGLGLVLGVYMTGRFVATYFRLGS